MSGAGELRERQQREARLDEERPHHFALEDMVGELRDDPSYETNGHTGLLLMKTDHLRVLLEVARAGEEISQHSVHGPTVLHVLAGVLHVEDAGPPYVAGPGEMIVVPRDQLRTLRAGHEDAAFLWVLSLETDRALAPRGVRQQLGRWTSESR